MFGVRDEFSNLDFPCVAQIVEHSNRPLMSDISREILEPMYQAFLVIHADAIWNPEAKSAEERRFMREKTRIYLELAGKLSDLLILHRGLASAFRVPAPRVAWLFDDYCGSPFGEVAYPRNFLRPFAHIIRSSIPSTVCVPDDMPFGRASELEKYVLVYIERTVGVNVYSRGTITEADWFPRPFFTPYHSRSLVAQGQPMTLDPSVYWCLSQAVTFDYFLGKPTYGFVPDARESFLSRISMAANLANKARGPSSALDVPLTPDFASLPQNALLEDGIEQTQNVGQALEKSATYADMGYAPNPSGRYFRLGAAVGQLARMAERFVDLYGYHGDGSPFDRALMFDNLNTLFRAMVLDKEYLRCGLGEAARYTFPDPSQEYAATRPNTPVLSSISEVADEMEEEENESDKENESP
ncbi:hypothetical protein B0H14DRAFT_3531784 [Mycena olivaceomarginata]|nr:hypothetical protein B0H14DRAFT_3531784 [Mycena olivaceomarginata]